MKVSFSKFTGKKTEIRTQGKGGIIKKRKNYFVENKPDHHVGECFSWLPTKIAHEG